jgi:hypothetical protein
VHVPLSARLNRAFNIENLLKCIESLLNGLAVFVNTEERNIKWAQNHGKIPQ